MALKTDEVIVIAAGAGLLLFWLILASTLSKFRSPSVSFLILLILGSLGAVFYGIHEDKSNLWWIIPTVVIGLCLVGVVYLVSRRIKSFITRGKIDPKKIANYYLGLSLEEQKRFGDKLNSSGGYHYVSSDFGKREPEWKEVYSGPHYYPHTGLVVFMRDDDLIHINVSKAQL